MGGMPRRVPLALLACLLALTAGCRRAPAPAPPPQPAGKPAPPRVDWRGPHGRTEVPLPDGRPLFALEGNLRGTLVGGASALAVLDAHGQSLLPEYDAACVAGRLALGLGDDRLRFEHRWQVRSPSRGLALTAERAFFSRASLEFTVPGTARLTYGPTRVEFDETVAQLDLRAVSGVRVRASLPDDPRGFALRAERGRVDAQRRLTLTSVTGTATQGGGPVAFASPQAVWQDKSGELVLTGGVSLTQGPFTLRADGARWRRADHRLTTVGTTRLEREGLTLSGTEGQAELAGGVARLSGLTGKLGAATLTARHGEVDKERQVTLSDSVRVTREGFALAAAKVVWRPDSGAVASGGVELTAPDAHARGTTAHTNADLSQATLTPVTATGHGDQGQWNLTAPSGTWQRDKGLKLVHPRGTFKGGGRQAAARAGSARYDQAQRKIFFADGFHADSPADDLVVDSRSAVYDEATQVFTATGQVRAVVKGITVTGRTWRYLLNHRPDEPLGGGDGP